MNLRSEMVESSSSEPTASSFVRRGGSPNPLLERLSDDIQREMLAASQAGLTISAEQWLDRHPEMKAEPEVAVLVIYEELCLREERGEAVDSAEIYRRFPQFRDALSVVLGCHRLMHSDPAIFPEAGEDFGEFRLLRELGRGGAGRVFLATQPALSDRPLVVKLTPRTGDEHLSLARLQHTHIVPLFLVQEFPERNLRALCMPFLGGASWSWILQALNAHPTAVRSGEGIVQVLEAAQSDPGVAPNSNGPAIGFLTQASFEQAVCWIGSCLADALHYAHQRGLLHLDIKPSNVLLAGDGQPMLLDFHLAHQVGRAQGGYLDRVGGTAGYMSPEQQRCVHALRAGRPLPTALDPRSDIYSLGVLLYESLAGQNPPADETRSRECMRKANPLVSRGLEDLLHKCLAQDSACRYADAGELAADLRRHVANLPLRGVGNRSLKERWQKWRKRKPHSLSTWTVSLTALAAISCAGLFFYTDRLQAARSALRQAKQDLENGDHAGAFERLTTGMHAIHWLPGQQDLKQDFQTHLVAAQGARVIGALHHLVEQLRFLDNIEDVPLDKLREVDAGCQAIWKERSQIVALAPDHFKGSEADEEIDLRDLALLWTRLATRSASASNLQEERAKALSVLDEAKHMWGPSPALTLARAQLTGQLVSGDQYAALLETETPRTAWEHDAVGRSLLQAGKLEQAREEFERAIQLEPDAFWPHFHLVLCAYRGERFDEALRSACVCVALSPRRAECFFNRALCFQAVEQRDEALRDFSRALELDPSLGAAAFQRGVLLAEKGNWREALDAFSRSAELASEPARAYYQMALIYVGQQNWTAARRYVEQALDHDSTYTPARLLQARLKTQAAPAATQ